MKNIASLRILTLFLSIVFLVGASITMAKTPSAESNSDSIRQVINQYERSLNASDTQSIMKLYGKKPIFMPQHSAAQVGRTAVKKAYETVFATIDLEIKFTTYEIEINKNTAWARTSSAGKTIILASGAKINEGNNELFVFKKEGGEWRIHRYLFSTTTPRQ